MREGNLNDALALYRKTLQVSPNSVPARTVNNKESALALIPYSCTLRVSGRGQRRVTHFRRVGISQIGRLNPAGINAPVKKVVGSKAQVGNQGDKKRSEAACVPGELQHP